MIKRFIGRMFGKQKKISMDDVQLDFLIGQDLNYAVRYMNKNYPNIDVVYIGNTRPGEIHLYESKKNTMYIYYDSLSQEIYKIER